MRHITRRQWLAAGATSAALALSGAAPSESTSPRKFESIPARELIRRRHLPNVELVTQEGRKVRFYDDLVKEKIVVINFMYANCGNACPLIAANLARVQKQLQGRAGRDIFLYSITLKPQEDTPQVLKHFAHMHGAGPGWLFLTGKPVDIELLRRALGFVFSDPAEDADKTNHIGMLRIGNEPMLRWSACEGLAHAQWIATSILSEADSPRKGGVRQAAAAK